MSINDHTKIPGYTSGILDCLLHSLIVSSYDIGISSMYYDLHDKYEKERAFFKEDSKLTFLNKVYKSVKRVRIKLFKKTRLIDKMEKIDIVEKLLKDSSYTINNLSWGVSIANDNGYDNKEILSNALESYDAFLKAIDSKVLSVNNSYLFHKEVSVNMDQLNYLLTIKMENGCLSFSKFEPEIGDLSEEAKSNISYDFVDIVSGHVLQEGETEDEVTIRFSDDVTCFTKEYYDDLKNIVLRLFNVCLYLDKQGMNVSSLSKDEYHTLFSAFHYYNLSDEIDNLNLKNEYVTTFNDLPIFYKMYIQSLAMILVNTVTAEEEFIELNNEYKKQNGIPVGEVGNDAVEDTVDYNELTHKLLLFLKKSDNSN